MPLTIWRMTDGKAGHDAQSRGLCQALSKITRIHCFDIETHQANHSCFNFIFKRFPAGASLPDPDLIIGAGHGTHLPMLAAKRARGGKTIVLMKPSLPLSWFDYCLIPEHDSPAKVDNVITTSGALNEIEPSPEKDNELLLIMIGGPAKHFHWNSEDVTRQVRQLCEMNTEKNIVICDSPRTPEDFFKILNYKSKNLVCFGHQALSRQDLLPKLSSAKEVWVTMDSISMIYEAMTAGAGVGLLELKPIKQNRITRAVSNLVENEKVVPFSKWIDARTLIPVSTFNEAQRCAEKLITMGISAQSE